MDNTFNLLKALCESLGYEVGEAPEFKLKKKPKERKSKEVTYSDEFEQIWELYPKRSGSNPKMKAYEQWNKRVSEETRFAYPNCPTKIEMATGVKRYAVYCKATKKEGTELVMQAARFFGREMEYLNDWTIPKEATKIKLPRNDDDLAGFAQLKGLSQPPRGMGFIEYRRLLESEIERRG